MNQAPPVPNLSNSAVNEQQELQQEKPQPSIPPTVDKMAEEAIGNKSQTEQETQPTEVKLLEYKDYTNVEQMRQAALVLIDSSILPNNITEPEQVIGIMKYGDELGVPAMTALNNIHMIQGRPTLGVHLISAQLKKYNIEFKLIEDYVGVEMNGHYDARTTYRFIDHNLLYSYKKELRDFTQMDEATKEIYKPILEQLREGIVKDISYYWSQAVGSQLIDKPNWQKDPRNMMRVRCLTTGARMVKPEALHGGYETTELAEAIDAEADIPVSYSVENT